MKDPRRSGGAHSARGSGSYVQQACSVCRQKKTKCDGNKPSCDACVGSGRGGECSYGKEPGRRPRTEAHFEAMRKQIVAYQEYIKYLESELHVCQKEHGGSTAYTFQQFGPLDWELPDSPEEMLEELEELEDELRGGHGSVANELCLPTQNLTLVEEGGLPLLHGATAPFRYIAEPVRTRSTGLRLSKISENPDDCYTLMIEGADESHFNPNFDWSRHLPSEVPLDRREHDKIVDLFFKFFTSWCLRIVPPLFLRDMCRALNMPKNQPPLVTSHYSAMLHNALIAVASAFSDDPRIRDFKSRQYYARKAKDYIEDECSRPNLCVVQALSLIGSFHSSQGDQTLGYLYFGMSARMSQLLGLGVDCSTWVDITEEDQMDRNWVYWTTFAQDVCWSFFVGRELSFPTISEQVPIPFVDADFDTMDWVHRPAGTQPQPGYLSRVFQASCSLLQIGRRIMEVVNTLDHPAGNRQVIRDKIINDIDVELHTWHNNLPKEINNSIRSRASSTPHRLQLHLTYHWSFILLHRPFFNRRSKSVVVREKDIDHVKICTRAADSIMDLLSIWRKLYTLRYAPITLVQVVFSAGTIYLLSALQATSGVRVAVKELKSSLDKARFCVDYLKEVGVSWQCATNISAILLHWMQSQVKPIVERRTISPSTSGFLPPKKIEDRATPNDGGSTKRKRTSVSRKRQRSTSSNGDAQGPGTDRCQPSGNAALPTPPLSQPPLSTPSSSASEGTVAHVPTPPTPTSITYSPQPLVAQSSFQTTPSHPRPSHPPPHNGIPPHPWNQLERDTPMFDATTLPPAPHLSQPEPQPPVQPRQIQPSPVNVNTLNLATFQPQMVLPNYRIWAPASLPPGSALGERPLSPLSRQMAMPNGQRLWEMPFLPFSTDPEDDPAAVAAVNELGFEFVRHQDMDWRGREGWEDIASEMLEENFTNWFG